MNLNHLSESSLYTSIMSCWANYEILNSASFHNSDFVAPVIKIEF